MSNRILKIIFVIILTVLPGYLALNLIRLDKYFFFCPIEYQCDLIIRQDPLGDGNFAAKRNGNRMHNGIDLEAGVGTPVFACRSGRAHIFVQKNGMGNYIILSHPDKLSTLYGHLSRIEVKDGDLVRQGQIIGLVGKTGNANNPQIQPHLHFELRKKGVIQDPLEYLE